MNNRRKGRLMDIKEHVKTLGCKVNQAESNKILEIIENNDIINEFFVINTCTLTTKTDSKCRNLINKIINTNIKNFDNFLIITGCFIERCYDELFEKYKKNELFEKIILVKNTDKLKINCFLHKIEKIKILIKEKKNNLTTTKILKDLIKKSNDFNEILNNLDIFIKTEEEKIKKNFEIANLNKNEFSKKSIILKNQKILEKNANIAKTRAFLKIQDGCDSFCNYCIVPFVRPKKWSLPFNELSKEIKNILNKNYQEIVLTGTRIGFYESLDNNGNIIKFQDILNEISKNKNLKRIRISSIEPTEITDEIIEIMAKNKNICEHLHISIQSGDDEILKKMNRNYDTFYLRNLFEKMRTKIKDLRITIDLIIGYLEESDKHFENTLKFLEEVKIDGIHIFPFSPRKGTNAYNALQNNSKLKIPTHILEYRKKIMLNFNKNITENSLKKFANRDFEVFFENFENIRNKNFVSGYTKNYMKVLCNTKKLKILLKKDENSQQYEISKRDLILKKGKFIKLTLNSKNIEINDKMQAIFKIRT
ncbi:MAG: MiaB/RimO family radical SAM methylthiotransferase [Elusimicrobiota bacterium]|jgi:threonylcarbamoyladenosine tRNA methylthiotransferase MtaB|nr:MiaB/RimO family radical SAM methylthiotransferase [Elusimicrobiota bacterium]